ncbi:unnamed protein product [Spirodela intermedia]|uniref:Uncharacterized protein n=1 Tax=Spirodela intermedia TaxID=51605 RepID=A0A7I8IKW9_SPIIN|nr:unnamed protein product [Spirodela intermedia]CAA6658531.1 unnamed protein product [Spirodela intermedia]
MAATQGVKCLNTSSGRRRFVFKTFTQRVNEIEIDVFRSLDPVKAEPSEGSSFFRDCLLEWRELNTAEDFISFYDEMMPFVQTLPQILLHKEKIFSELLSRVNMKAKLSLEPILRLIASFSRDILEDFLPLLQRLVNSFIELFENGGERDSDVLEQVFTSWSYILMYLQKYLIKDIANVLQITIDLRYYPNHYIQEFMAEALSFLLRSAPKTEVLKVRKKVVTEAAEDSSETRKTGASALLWHVMIGTSSRLHSKAEQVLRKCLSSFSGSDAVVDVVNGTLQRLCEVLEPKELNLACNCLLEEIHCSDDSGFIDHLNRLLSILVFIVQLRKGANICEIHYTYYFQCRNCLETVNKVFELMLSLLDVQSIVNELSATSQIVLDGALSSRVAFIHWRSITKDSPVLNAFKMPIISALDDRIISSPDEVLYLLLVFFEKAGEFHCSDSFIGQSKDSVSKIRRFFDEKLCFWSNMITKVSAEASQRPGLTICHSNFAMLWGILQNYSHFFCSNEKLSLITKFIEAVTQLLSAETDEIAGLSKTVWQSIAAASLVSYQKLLAGRKAGHAEISKILHIAGKISPLPSCYLLLRNISTLSLDRLDFIDFNNECSASAIKIFAENLSQSDKLLRTSTLRILSHFALLDKQPSKDDVRPSKKLKTEPSGNSFFVSTSRVIIVLISKIQMNIAAGKINDAYVPLLLNGLIGIVYNRFGSLWEPAIECLSVLLGRHKDLAWNQFIECLENVQLKFLSAGEVDMMSTDHPKPNGLVNCFNLSMATHSDSTPRGTVLGLLIRTLQKVPDIAEARSRQVVPLFLKFLGLENVDVSSGGSFGLENYLGKGWKSVLKDWLNLLRLLHNSRSLYLSQVLKNVLMNRLLDDTDPDTQLKVLDCMLNWKDDYLLPYGQHLKNLIIAKNLREELTTWTLAKESSQIQEAHRGFLVPIVIRILVPKVRKLKTLASRKHASVNHRRAILCFLTQLDVNELPLFFSLLLKPLFSSADGTSAHENQLHVLFDKFLALPLSFLQTELLSTMIAGLSSKKKFSFLHVVVDILRSFDEFHVKPFLDLLLAIVVKILSGAQIAPLFPETPLYRKRSNSEAKDLRSLCLKIFCFTLNKYGSHHICLQIWDIFFSSVKPLIDSFIQDISGSENPSSLLLCFVAMSKNPRCISLLDGFLPNIFSVLTVKTASESVTSSVLSFVENLLVLDSELDHEDDLVKKILMPHLKDLFSGLCQFFQRRRVSQRKTIIWPAMEEIRIFKLLGRYVNETSIAREFIDIMLPFFGKKGLNSDECLEGLHVIEGMLPMLDSVASRKILNVISMVLISARLDIKLLICKILDGLSVVDPSLAFLAKLVHDLNASSATELDEIDYDTRISAYDAVTVQLFSSLGHDRASIVLSQCFNDIASDLILRQTASRALVSFIDFAALFLGCDAKGHDDAKSDGLMLGNALNKETETVDANVWTRKQILKIIAKFFLQNMGETMNKEISSQKEWIILLREMVCKLPGVPALLSLRPLYSEDPEVDFFHNIFHLQTYRRAKALSCFRNAVSIGNLSEEMMQKVFVPLFLTMMFEVKGGKGEHLKNAFIESLASMSGQMQWKAYISFLMKIMWYIQKTHSKSDKQKILLRLLISVLDTFHFCSNENILALTTKNSISTVADPDVVQHTLQHKILPQIQKFLDVDSDRINAHMSLAALKILKLLPEEILESQLQTIIRRISNFLKSRLESIRDEARSVLAACLKELGVGYLNFIVKVLQATLKRGYECHVLGYTLNFILSKLFLKSDVGALDSCLEEILFIVENDILGRVSEEEAAKFASRMKETRKKKSFETLKLVSQNITFKTHALKLLSPIRKHLQNHLTIKAKAKLEKMLNCIASGIETNPSVDEKELLIFIYGLLEDGDALETVKLASTRLDNNNQQSPDVSKDEIHPIGNGFCSSHLILLFALRLLHNRLKNMKLDKKNEELLSSCLSSKYEDILSAAFKCLIPLTRLPLPSLELHADKIKILLLDITQRSSKVTSPLMQSCLKLLTVLLQTTTVSLSNDQLQMLVQFPIFIDIQAKPSHVALSLLKAIVARKLVVHEIYDLVVQISELMVTSQDDPIRKKCSQILLQFLVDYHISSKLFSKKKWYLFSYEHSSGREAVLEMLHAILVKLPPAVVENQAQSWFLHLVVALANDTDKNVQSMVGTVIKLLLGRISQKTLHPILEYSLSWYRGEKQHLWSAAAQVLGLLVDILKKGFLKYNISVLPVAKCIMDSAIDIITKDKDADWSTDVVPLWKEAYTTLLMLEKMLCQCPELYFDASFEEIWEAICKFLLHPHVWVRNTSNRLLALYFSQASDRRSIRHERSETGGALLLNPARLFLLAVSFCAQLKAQFLDDTASNLVIQNLLFSICGVHSHAKELGSTPIHAFWAALGPHEQRFYLDAFELLGSRKGRNAFLFHTASDMPQAPEGRNSKPQSLLVLPLLGKLGKIALTGDDVQTKMVFDCFRRLSSQLGHEGCTDYAVQLLSPLYRVCEGFSGKVISDEIKELATEVLEKMRGVLGADHFVRAYNEIRKTMKEKRDKRRQAEKLLAVINPMRHAQRKLRIAAKHRANKKKKISAMKMRNWKR